LISFSIYIILFWKVFFNRILEDSRNSDYPDEKYLNNNNLDNVQIKRNGSNTSNRKLSIDHFKFIGSRLSNRNNVTNQSGQNATNGLNKHATSNNTLF